MQSMYSLPPESQTRAPLPRVMRIGWRVYVGWMYLASASMGVMVARVIGAAGTFGFWGHNRKLQLNRYIHKFYRRAHGGSDRS